MKQQKREAVYSGQTIVAGNFIFGILSEVNCIDNLFFPSIAATVIAKGIEHYVRVKEENKLLPRLVEYKGEIHHEKPQQPIGHAISASILYGSVSTGCFGAGYSLAYLVEYIF